jgi:hypothetical protein
LAITLLKSFNNFWRIHIKKSVKNKKKERKGKGKRFAKNNNKTKRRQEQLAKKTK